MGNLFHLDGWRDRVAALGRCSQDLVQSLLAARFLLVDVRIVVNRRHIVGLNLRIDLVLEDLLHGTSEGALLDEVAHTCLAVGLPDLQLLVKGLPRHGLAWTHTAGLLLRRLLVGHWERLSEVRDRSGVSHSRGLDQAWQRLLLLELTWGARLPEPALALMPWHSLRSLIAQELLLERDGQRRLAAQRRQSRHGLALFAHLRAAIAHIVTDRVLGEAGRGRWVVRFLLL